MTGGDGRSEEGATAEHSDPDSLRSPSPDSSLESQPPPVHPSQSPAAGRPPLHNSADHNHQAHPSPLGLSGPPERPQPAHDRLHSTGEYSFISALTDTSAADLDHPRRVSSRRNRTVSFDRQVIDQFDQPPPPPPPPPVTNILQPLLSGQDAGRTSSGDQPSSIFSPTNKPISLEGLQKVNPLESEAEAAILKAVEEEFDISRTAVPLPHVPDEVIDVYDGPSQNQPSDRSLTKAKSEPDPPTSPTSASSRSQTKLGGDLPQQRSEPIPSPSHPSHRRGKSNFSMANRDRTDSIEATLHDLTSAMRAMHEESTPRGLNDLVQDGQPRHRHNRTKSNMMDVDIFGATMPEVQEIPESSADALVQNANMLFRRNFQRDDASIRTLDLSNSGSQDEADYQSRLRFSRRRFGSAAPTDAKKTDGLEITEESAEGEGSDSDEIGTGVPDPELGNLAQAPHSGSQEQEATKKKVSTLQKSSRAITNKARNMVHRANKRAQQDWEFFSAFINPMQSSIQAYCKTVLFYIIIPMICLAAILYYGAGNPLLRKRAASISWLILFLVRQVVTFSMAKATELFLIDFLSLGTRITVRVLGPTMTLVVVQSKGFPFILFAWAIYSLLMNSGDHAFAHHWLFYQNAIDLFNASNPSGDIPSSETNYRVLITAIVCAIAVTIKRVMVGLYLGKRTLGHYGDQLAEVIQKMILVSEVAQLSRDYDYIDGQRKKKKKSLPFPRSSIEPISGWRVKARDNTQSSGAQDSSIGSFRQAEGMWKDPSEKVIDSDKRDERTGSLNSSQRFKMMQLLEDWEEPEEVSRKQNKVSIDAILQFRQALAFMENVYPFSFAFGYAGNREACVESAQKVYELLRLATPDVPALPFDTIGVLATSPQGKFDHQKMKALIRIFRPDRDGNLTMLDFVRSCDSVYKEMRLLRASINNSCQIDNALEKMINVVFYILLTCIALAANGLDPLAIFLSFSSVILAFAFMIGSASSKYFEGILFILLRRPYDIGDLVAIGDPNSVSAFHGAIPWFVLNVDLFTTTVRYAPTGEVATIANGSLANSRIINGARSTAPVNHIFMKFGVDIPYTKVQLFQKAVETFVKERPREWVCMLQFRATRVVPDEGFIEYVIVVQHRDKWQNIGAVLQSQADLSSFVLEVSKQLDMRYHAPPMPVDVTMKDKTDSGSVKDNETDQDEKLRAISSMFGRPEISRSL